MKKYKLLKDAENPWVRIQKGAIFTEDEYGNYKGEAVFSTGKDFISLNENEVNNPGWFEEILEKEFTRKDLLEFTEYYQRNKLHTEVESCIKDWMFSKKSAQTITV